MAEPMTFAASNEADGTDQNVAVTAPAGMTGLSSGIVYVMFRIPSTEGANPPTVTGFDRLSSGLITSAPDRLRCVAYHWTHDGATPPDDFSASDFPATTTWWHAVYVRYESGLTNHRFSTPLAISQGSGQATWTGAEATITPQANFNAGDVNDAVFTPIFFAIWTPNAAGATWTTQPATFTDDFDSGDIVTGIGGNFEHAQLILGQKVFHDHGSTAVDMPAADPVGADSDEVAGRGMLLYTIDGITYFPPPPGSGDLAQADIPETKILLRDLPNRILLHA